MPAVNAVAGLILCLAILSYGAFRFISKRRFYHAKPGPPHSLLWGHMGIMRDIMAKMPPNMHIQAIFTEIAHTYGLEEIFYLDLWPIGLEIVVLNGPILSEQASVIKRYPQHPFASGFLEALVGPNALAATNGPLWKKLHRAVVPACSWSNVHSMTRSIVDETKVFCEILGSKAASGEAFPLEGLGGQLIFDIVGRVILDIPLYAQTTGSEYLDDIRGIVQVAEASMEPKNMLNPISRMRIWWKKWYIASRLDPRISDMIRTRSAALARGGKSQVSTAKACSILNLLVEDLQKDNKADLTETLTTRQCDLIITNTLTAHLQFLFMLLSMAPQVVEEIRREHATVLGNDLQQALDCIVETPELLQNLTYTEAACKEALRLFPVGVSPKDAGKGGTLTLEGEVFPVGDGRIIFLNGQDLHYNPRYFPEPTRFRPERWLDAETKVPRGYFRTFATGPRTCAGQNMAYSIYKIVLLLTLSKFDFECYDCRPNAEPRTCHTDLDTVFGDRIFQKWAVEAKPRGGMMMTVKERVSESKG
ncbi:putative sterigmatocystin biosynthesis P450 monooxygenase [Escovopsis weberi]|uniref:Putative sterigmatocystin biosynthesis P450 monooxygenase n=1 Tax=Escovopsis weberi TaxID=150374 RepID=A0A0M9VUB7_ESCWE|nr:putative sterigmatocystin biosynthesis P450 monooxygenase [Escovopsis weberi]